MKSSWLRQSL